MMDLGHGRIFRPQDPQRLRGDGGLSQLSEVTWAMTCVRKVTCDPQNTNLICGSEAAAPSSGPGEPWLARTTARTRVTTVWNRDWVTISHADFLLSLYLCSDGAVSTVCLYFL